MFDPTHDYIIIGGGLAGAALAGRLAQKSNSLKILIIEAGPNVVGHPLTSIPLACLGAHFSPLDWAYTTAPQTHLDRRSCYASGGKALGGGTATNYGTWTRGNAADFDLWAKIVGDQAWNYKALLPYFKMTETHFDPNVDPTIHGLNGPIHCASISSSGLDRTYPLKESLRAAWEKIGVKVTPDANAGSPKGLGELVENWHTGRRQLSSEAYGLSSLPGVSIITNTLVKRVLLQDHDGKKIAIGVKAVDGKNFLASKEVIVSAGAYRTPQVLMLSGIGPAEELERYSIPVHVNAPEVGRDFHDHSSLNQWWKLRHPEAGQAIGTPLWKSPAYMLGLPCDWLATEQAPHDEVAKALKTDGETVEGHPYLAPNFCHTETVIAYAPAGAAIAKVNIPMDVLTFLLSSWNGTNFERASNAGVRRSYRSSCH